MASSFIGPEPSRLPSSTKAARTRAIMWRRHLPRGLRVELRSGKVARMSEATDQVMEESELALSEAAAARIRSLIEEEGNPALKLRVYISGGGCSGFQYGFGVEAQAEEDDHELVRHGVTLLVDPLSMPYLEGAEIDYKEDLEGERFIINNPNATTTCGCGSSFAA